MSAPECSSTSEFPGAVPLHSSQPLSGFFGFPEMGSGAGGAGKCQLLLRTPPEMVSMVEPSALTCISPTSSNCPVTGLIDQRSIRVPGAQPERLGNVIGAGVAKTISPG